jgi:hypothetical protein
MPAEMMGAPRQPFLDELEGMVLPPQQARERGNGGREYDTVATIAKIEGLDS